MRPETPLV